MSLLPVSRQEFKKHVGAIHTSGELSLLERKLSNVLLLHAYDQLLLERTHTLPTGVLSAFLGYDSKDTTVLKRALRSLVTTAIEFNLMQDGKEKWSVTSMLSFAEIREGVCTWRYDEHLAERLYDPEIYSLINVSVQRQLQSSHSLALYENCLRYRNVGSTGWWDIDRFRKLLGATSDAYSEFRRLNEKVIRPAIAEINRSSDIQIAVEFEKKGRGGKVSSIRFKISEHPQQLLFKPENTARKHGLENNEAYKLLRELGVSERLASSTVQQDEQWALSIAQSTQGKVAAGKIKNPGAYAARLIRDGVVLEPPKPLAETAKTGAAPIPNDLQRETYRLQLVKEKANALLASISKEKRIELVTQFVDQQRQKGNAGIAFVVDMKAGFVLGAASSLFEAYVAKTEVGSIEDIEVDEYIRARHLAAAS